MITAILIIEICFFNVSNQLIAKLSNWFVGSALYWREQKINRSDAQGSGDDV